MIRKILRYFSTAILQLDTKKLIFFWALFAVLMLFVTSTQMGKEEMIGHYHTQEIVMTNVSISISGRPYEKVVIIHDGNRQYQAACIGNYNPICETFFNRTNIPIRKLIFNQMHDNKGFILYAEFEDHYMVMNQITQKNSLEQQYIQKGRYIRLILFMPVLLTMLLCIVAIWQKIHVMRFKK